LAYTFSKKHMCSFLFFSLFYSFCFSPLFIREESRSQQKRTETAHPKVWSPRCCCRLLHPGTKIARL
jgi:Zn-finger protein